VASFFLVHDFPDRARFLTLAERIFVIERLKDDFKFSAGGEKFRLDALKQCFFDKKTYAYAMVYLGTTPPLYGISLFSPSIISGLGFNANRSNLLSIPVYAVAAVVAIWFGFLGDRYGRRSLLSIIGFGTAVIGSVILIISRNAALSYIALYILTTGIFSIAPNTVVWSGNNTEGTYKRGILIAFGIGIGILNSAALVNAYRAQDRPWYRFGHFFMLMYCTIGLISSVVLRIVLMRENARRDRGERDEVIGVDLKEVDEEKVRRNGRYDTVEAARMAKGDMWSGFRYDL